MAEGRRVKHDITVRLSPLIAKALCSCGWSFTVTRRQNALARKSKLDAAMKLHWHTVSPRLKQE